MTILIFLGIIFLILITMPLWFGPLIAFFIPDNKDADSTYTSSSDYYPSPDFYDEEDYPSQKKSPKKSDFNDDYEHNFHNYYQELSDDALSGSKEAIEEMQGEFGDDWEGEY